MRYLLVMNPRSDATADMIARALDAFPYPWEWQKIEASVSRVIVSTFYDLGQVDYTIRTYVDQNVFTTFVMWVKEEEVGCGV